ncbi:hypothetical protein [Mycobacteroides abscessus]|uniref:hypothetical protein n=1 Tax=Mycobacteroides abscessus TaxID=36809 RepID=UPI001F363985|nr:hypothetical protein [Mycobacteroides abscessus]
MSQSQRIALTSDGQVIAVLHSSKQVDEQAHQLRQVTWAVMEAAAALVASRNSRYSLDELCARAHVNVERVRMRAARMRNDSTMR